MTKEQTVLLLPDEGPIGCSTRVKVLGMDLQNFRRCGSRRAASTNPALALSTGGALNFHLVIFPFFPDAVTDFRCYCHFLAHRVHVSQKKKKERAVSHKFGVLLSCPFVSSSKRELFEFLSKLPRTAGSKAKGLPLPLGVRHPKRKKSERFQHGSSTKSKARRRSFWKHKWTEESPLGTLTDICHLKMRSENQKNQKYKRSLVLRGNIVKDDSGACAVFTEQGSSASQMIAAKIMDVIARLPGCDGQVADAVSADTQVKMKDAPKLFRIPVGMSRCVDTSSTIWPKCWSDIKDPGCPLERHLYGHPLAGLLWERQLEEQSPNGQENVTDDLHA